jgi:hypothetical protein
MQKRPKIGIIISTTRPGRFADIPTDWLFDIAKLRNDADFEILDLRDYPMPFFEEKMALAYAPAQNETHCAGRRRSPVSTATSSLRRNIITASLAC